MLDEEYPDAVLVSEWGNPQSIRAGFHADFMLDHHGNPYNLLVRGEEEPNVYSYFDKEGRGDAGKVAELFTKWYDAVKDSGYIAIISCNHDTPRLAPFYTRDALKLIYSTLFTLPGVPFLYYGDEIGMKYMKDIPSVECGFGRTGSRTPMQWSTEKNAGFSTADKTFLPTEIDKEVNVESQEKDKKSLLNFIRKLFEFRRDHDDFTGCDLEFLHAKGSEPLVYRRGNIVCAVNPRTVKGRAPIVLEPKTPAIFAVGKEAKIRKEYLEVPPMSFTVFETKTPYNK